MFSWVRSQLREHGALAAARVFWRFGWSRVTGAVADSLLPRRVECPCCGWTGRHFYDYVEVRYLGRRVECPRCYSHRRHRLFYLWLRDEYRLEDKRGTALVFAPEKALDAVWARARGLRVIRTDIEPARGVDVLADIQRLPFASDAFDLVWCHHVLTQIPDDRAAIRELQRVLRPRTGELVISAAVTAEAETREFGFANPDLLGFWRIYGRDFAARLGAGGLEVRAVNYRLPAEDSARYGVSADEVFYVCTKAGPSPD